MNPKIQSNLDTFKEDIVRATTTCVVGMMPICADASESVAAMDKIVDVIAEQQQRAVFALVSATLDMEKESGEVVVPHSALRKYVLEAAEAFRSDLIHNTSHNLKAHGHPDIMSPNQIVVDEILEADNANN